MHVRRGGAGAPVVCLHAIAHDGRDFDDLRDRLAGDFDIIAPDWPGHGQSAPMAAAPDAHAYARLVETLIDEMKLDRPILLGNSIGGAAALVAATRRPERVRGLVLCNAGGLAPVDIAARFVIARMTDFFDAGAQGARWFPGAFDFYYRRIVLPRDQARARRDDIIAQGPSKARLLADAWRGFAREDADLRTLAPLVACPTLAAWAQDDRVIAWSRSRAAIRQIPDVRSRLFRGGHAAFLEDPDRFERAFRDFAAALPT